MEGYSGTPLASKLGIKVGHTVALVHAPRAVVLEIPAGVTVRRTATRPADVVVAFYTRAARLASEVADLSALIFPAGGLWIAWPKKASGVATDLSDNPIRAICLPLGLVDNKVCAIDATWCALRVVWRVSRRTVPGSQ